MDRVFRRVKRRISDAQEARRVRVGGKARCGYAVGDTVRIKLQPAQRTKGKLHAHKSELYTVVHRTRNTYLVKPCGPNALTRTLQRHYNELKAAPPQQWSWEHSSSTHETGTEGELDVSPSEAAQETTPIRRSGRVRRNQFSGSKPPAGPLWIKLGL